MKNEKQQPNGMEANLYAYTSASVEENSEREKKTKFPLSMCVVAYIENELEHIQMFTILQMPPTHKFNKHKIESHNVGGS